MLGLKYANKDVEDEQVMLMVFNEFIMLYLCREWLFWCDSTARNILVVIRGRCIVCVFLACLSLHYQQF